MDEVSTRVARSEYICKESLMEGVMKTGNIGYIYERFEDIEEGKKYVGKTIRSINERHTEHSK